MIIVKDVKKFFDNGLTVALNGVSLQISKGEVVAISGPSGCGKSTLLNIIGTLEVPTSGEVFIEGENISKYYSQYNFRAKTIGFVFQFHYLIPTMTLIENVELPMYSLSIPKNLRREKAKHILDCMGLSDRANFFPTKVSGGERQRAAIARAIANDPKIILADEPTGNLDIDNGEMVMNYLLNLCKKESITLLITTHNPSVASMAGRIIYMKNGKVEK
ncbi:MAG: ABC transporter ATP-binding protein [Nitrospirae bacterium]|nr:ABC transporter ATP-binding protein [Nitrospirota bacterium]